MMGATARLIGAPVRGPYQICLTPQIGRGRMCGRIVQASGPLRLAIGDGLDVREDRTSNVPRRYNGAPSQQLLLIRKNHRTGDRSLDLLAWGLIPNWCQDLKWWTQTDQRQSRDHCRDAYRLRRCIVPVDGCVIRRIAGSIPTIAGSPVKG